jgi:hypothetical protein
MAEVLTVVVMKISVSWDITLCSQLKVYQLYIVISQKIELFSGFMNLTRKWWIRANFSGSFSFSLDIVYMCVHAHVRVREERGRE